MKFPTAHWMLSCCCLLATTAQASVFLPHATTIASSRSFAVPSSHSRRRTDLRCLLRKNRASAVTAMAIPGNGIAEQVFVGGFSNFLSIYNLVITARILLSWFPQAQGIGALQPVFAITDPFLNLFRGVVPPIFGLDFSPILAFFLLNVVTNATAAVGSTLPPEKLQELRRLQRQRNTPVAAILSRSLARRNDPNYVSLNL